MSEGRPVDSVDDGIALAFGLFALSDAELHEAASRADVTRWELEAAIERAGFADQFGLDTEKEASDTIDDLFETDQ